MELELPEIPTEQRTPLVESLLVLLHQILEHAQQFEQTNRRLQDAIALLKGQVHQRGHPSIPAARA